MATKTIGATGRDYATCALYASYLDGLNTLSAAEVGNFYNDGEFAVAGDVMVLTGFVPSASNTVTMQPATGQGFKDASGATTNPQCYDASKGVALRRTTNYGYALELGSIPYVTIKGFQIRGSGGSAGAFTFLGSGARLDSCIIEDYRGLNRLTTGSLLINSLFISFANPTGAPIVLEVDAGITNSSIVRPSDVSGAGVDAIQASYAGTKNLLNVNIFGFANAINVAGGSVNSTTCYTDDASPPSGFTTATYSSQFENTVAATRDFRTKSGATIIGAGTNSGAPTLDIVGQTRPNPPTVGHFELLSGGGAITLDADQGTVTVTGYAATTRFSVAAAQGVVSVSGQAATTRLGMAAAQGTVAVAGQASTVAFLTAAAQGSVAVTGQAATVNWQMAGAQGSVAITGYDATFDLPATGNITLDADTGTVTIVGFDALMNWTVQAAQGSISVSGQASAVLWGLNANLGTLSLVGYDADFDGVTGISSGVGKPRKGKKRRKVLVGDRVFWSDQKEAIAQAIAALQAERAQARAEKVAPKAPKAAQVVSDMSFAPLEGLTAAEIQAMQADDDEDDIECLLMCS